MTDDTNEDKPQIEVTGDEDWKEKVAAENAKLDAEAQAGQKEEAEKSPDSEEEIPQMSEADLPPANLSTLVQMFSTQAIVAMGLIPSPDGKQIRQPALGKHFIDLIAVIEEKTKGNISSEEEQMLEMTLHELRMAYIRTKPAPKS